MASDPKAPERRPGGAAKASETARSRGAPPDPITPPLGVSKVTPPAKVGSTSRRSGARRSGAQRVLVALGAITAVGCLLAACSIGYVNWRLGQISRLDLALSKPAAGGPQNILIVGSDSRTGITKNDPNSGAFLNDPQYANGTSPSDHRSDTIMILRVDPSKTKAQLLSLPRDLYVPIAGTNRSDKINSAFGIGQKTLIQTIQNEFGIAINHYAEVDFSGFQKLVDAMGGIPMYFDKPMWDGHTGLDISHVGCATLNGTQALAFARSRYLWTNNLGRDSVDTTDLKYLSNSQMNSNGWTQDGTSDLGRISRQQLLIRTAIPLAEHKALRNPATLNAIVGTAVESITLDKGLSTSDLIGLAQRFKSFDANSLVTYSYPSTMKWVGGSQVQEPNRAEAEKILARFRPTSSVPEAQVSVDVLNASGVAAQAANVAGALQRVGFEIASTGNAATAGIDHLDHTQIRYAPGDEGAAKILASHLSVAAELTPIVGMASGTVMLVTGSDFTTVTTVTHKLTQYVTSTTAPSGKGTTTSPGSTSTVVGVVPSQDHAC